MTQASRTMSIAPRRRSARQFGTIPLIYQAKNLVGWELGPLLGATVLAGFPADQVLRLVDQRDGADVLAGVGHVELAADDRALLADIAGVDVGVEDGVGLEE